VDFLVGDADVGGADSFFCFGRSMLVVGARANFAPVLRSIVLVGQPALRRGLDLQSIGLRPVGCRDDLVVRLIC